jgi:hypothetical protein
MANILIPGYLKWDGQKYIIDPLPVGPQGAPGAVGPAGPTGPQGPAGSGGGGTLAGDVTGASNDNEIQSIKGVLVPSGDEVFDGASVVAYQNAIWVQPQGLAFDSFLNQMWVTDSEASNITLFNTADNSFQIFSLTIPGVLSTDGLYRCVVDANYVYAIGRWSGTTSRLVIISKTTHQVVGYGIVDAAPSDISLGDAGHVYVSVNGFSGHGVFGYTISSLLSSYPTPVAHTSFLDQNAQDLTYDGTYLYTDWVSQVFQITLPGLTVNDTYAGAGGESFAGLVSDAGSIWTVDGNVNSTGVVRINPSGMTAIATIPLSGTPISPKNIGAGDGRIWVSDAFGTSNNSVWVISEGSNTEILTVGTTGFSEYHGKFAFDGTLMWSAIPNAITTDDSILGSRQGLESYNSSAVYNRFVGPVTIHYASPVTVLDGDVTGHSNSNTVSNIKDVPTPAVGTEFDGALLEIAPIPVFTNPIDIAWDGTIMWVADSNDQAISTFDTSTFEVVKYPVSVSGVFTFGLRKVAVDADYVYAILATTDATTKIVIFSKTTHKIVGLGNIDLFSNGTEIVIDGVGNIFVWDQNGVLSKFDIATLLSSYPTAVNPSQTLSINTYQIRFDGTYLYASAGNQIFQIDPITLTIGLTYTGTDEGYGSLHFAFGSIWCSDSVNGKLSRIEPSDMTLIADIPFTPSASNINIYYISDDGTLIWAIQSGVAVYPYQSIYFIDPGSNSEIDYYTNGTFSEAFSGAAFDGSTMWLPVSATGVLLPPIVHTGLVGYFYEGGISEVERFTGPLSLIYGPPPPPSGTATGDLAGAYPNPEVIGIHGIVVPTPSVFTDVGKVLTVGSSFFSPTWTLTTPASATLPSPPEQKISGIAGYETTSNTSFEEHGGLVFWASHHVYSSKTLHVIFQVIIEVTVGGDTIEVDLYNPTNASSIVTLSTSATIPTWVDSSEIASNPIISGPGDLYVIRIRSVNGNPVICKQACLVLSWTDPLP